MKFKTLPIIDSSWTLFLDRDGVINVETGDYIHHRGEFQFEENALPALEKLSRYFGRIIVITNQRGVEKELMSLADLHDVHHFMLNSIQQAGGRIDEIYYCTSLDNDHPDRKPHPGMALRAQQLFPEINFAKSFVLGDKLGDMQLGRTIGAFTVLIPSLHSEELSGHPDIDVSFNSLSDFANAVLPLE